MGRRSAACLAVCAAGCRQLAGLSDPIPATTVTVDHDAIDLAVVPCGASSSLAITITNGTAAAIDYTITADLPGITVNPATGTIEPGMSQQVTVTATADAIADPGTALSGTLTVDTSDPDAGSISIPITYETSGGVLTVDRNTVDFGQVAANTMHDGAITLANAGNALISVSAGPFANTAFAITSSASFDLAPGAQQTVGVRFDPPLDQAYMYQLPLTASGATCRALPTVVVVGVASTNQVLLDHSTIDFGNVACGASSATSMLTLTNSNAQSYPFTASVTAGASAFSVAPTSGTLPGSGTASTTVTRGAVPAVRMPGQVTGNLRVVVTGVPNGTTDVPLLYTVSGPYLTPSSTSVYVEAALYSTSSRSVTITNSGDQVASVQVTKTGSSELNAPSSFQVAPGGTAQFTVTFHPTVSGSVSATFTLTAAGQCSSALVIQANGQVDTGV